MKIELAPVNLKYQEITEFKYMHLTLQEDYFIFCCDFLANEPKDKDDPVEIWQNNVRNFLDTRIFKTSVLGIERTITIDPMRWKISILLHGNVNDISLYFYKRLECETVFEMLNDYFFSKQK